MDINQKQIKTAEEYINFVREFVTLLDRQLIFWEESVKNYGSSHELANQMPALISLVNTVGYLRGQDGVFLDIRPITENQKEFYDYEYLFESRLEKLIGTILNSKEKEFYQDRLKECFIKVRTKQNV